MEVRFLVHPRTCCQMLAPCFRKWRLEPAEEEELGRLQHGQLEAAVLRIQGKDNTCSARAALS